MREVIAFLIMATVIVFLAVYWSREHQAIYAMPLIKASEPASVVPWVLNTRCPVNSKNLPVKETRA